jgi:hypothetical protein
MKEDYIRHLKKCCGEYPRYHVNRANKTVYVQCPNCGRHTRTYNIDPFQPYAPANKGWNDMMEDILDKTRSE